jgi:hypothetical protein
MARFESPIEILKVLDGSNCRECGKPTCMAFAVAVHNGQQRLDECPKVAREIVEEHGGDVVRETAVEPDLDRAIEQLAGKIAAIDLPSRADRLGASFADGRLTIKCLGRDFSVDSEGKIRTDLHLHGWLAVPALCYILRGGEIPISGDWVSFRDLEGGAARYPLFAQRCEKPCQQLADADTELFADVVGLFGKPTENQGSSHLSLVLKPLPRLPILIRYWKPEDGLASHLSFLFDSTAAANLNVESIYVLATRLVVMFEKIARKHGSGA